MDWRTIARKHIDEAVAEAKTLGLEGKDIERHVRKAYPFGERAMWPYKVWCSEMRRRFPDPRRDKPQPLFESHSFMVMPGKGDNP